MFVEKLQKKEGDSGFRAEKLKSGKPLKLIDSN